MANENSIYGKLRLLILGNIHALLNKAIDLNSIPAIEQHLRDLANALDELESSADEAEGRKRYLSKQVTAKSGEKTGVDASIKAILGDGNPENDHLAKTFGVKAVSLQKAIAELNIELADATETDTTVDQAVSQLKARIESLNGTLEGLRIKDASAKAKEQAASALTSASSIMGQGTGLNVDNIKTRIEQRDEVASAKLERAMGSMNLTVEGDTQMAEADLYLEQMKASLGK